MNMFEPNLTQHPPRSPRARLGGYVTLPRMLDKGRATVAGTNGEYHFDCPVDQRLLAFMGLEAEAVKTQLAAGRSDSEMLAWMEENAIYKRSPEEIAVWSAHQEQRAPSGIEAREFFQKEQSKIAPGREDIETWFDLLDLDDYTSFGGMA